MSEGFRSAQSQSIATEVSHATSMVLDIVKIRISLRWGTSTLLYFFSGTSHATIAIQGGDHWLGEAPTVGGADEDSTKDRR